MAKTLEDVLRARLEEICHDWLKEAFNAGLALGLDGGGVATGLHSHKLGQLKAWAKEMAGGLDVVADEKDASATIRRKLLTQCRYVWLSLKDAIREGSIEPWDDYAWADVVRSLTDVIAEAGGAEHA